MVAWQTVGDTQYNTDSVRGMSDWVNASRVGGSNQISAAAQAERDRLAQEAQQSAAAQAAQMGVASAAQQAAAAAASRQQAETLAKNEATQAAATEQARADIEPWWTAGTEALAQLTAKIEAGPGEFTESPGYQFRLAEGQKAIENSAAARGNSLSGAAVKAATRYGQDFATNDYQAFLDRYYTSLTPLQDLSNKGYEAGQQMGGFTMQGAANVTNLAANATNQMGLNTRYGADAEASGIVNAANIMAAQQQAANERDYNYQAWKAGENF